MIADEQLADVVFLLPDPSWQPARSGRHCRYTVGPRHQQCGRTATWELDRGQQKWAYCDDHLYGHVVLDGQVYMAHFAWRSELEDFGVSAA